MTFAEFETFCQREGVTHVTLDRSHTNWSVSGWQATPAGNYVRARATKLSDAVDSFSHCITSKLTTTSESGQSAPRTDLTGIL